MLRESAALIEMAFLRPLKPCRRKVPWRREPPIKNFVTRFYRCDAAWTQARLRKSGVSTAEVDAASTDHQPIPQFRLGMVNKIPSTSLHRRPHVSSGCASPTLSNSCHRGVRPPCRGQWYFPEPVRCRGIRVKSMRPFSKGSSSLSFSALPFVPAPSSGLAWLPACSALAMVSREFSASFSRSPIPTCSISRLLRWACC